MNRLEKDPRYEEHLQRGYNVPKDGVYPAKPQPSPAPPQPHVKREATSREK